MNESIIIFAKKYKGIIKSLVPKSVLKSIRKKAILNRIQEIANSPKENLGQEKKGVNLIASIKGDFGLGQSSRLVAGILKASGIPYCIYNYEYADSNTDMTYADEIQDKILYGINLIHINPLELEVACLELPDNILKGHYNIGFWLWEQAEFPDYLCTTIPVLDEVWTPAEFISQGIRKITDKPVRTLPYAITVPYDEKMVRSYFSLPEDKFLFLMMYDSNSILERKNPEAVMQAFKKAFSGDDDKVGLVIKVNSAQEKDLDIIRHAMGDYRNIYLLTKSLTKIEVNSLIRDVDVIVSLHRAEGFGLVLAEAMLLGTPTIATNWSANIEFQTSETACLVSSEPVELQEDIGPYKKGSRWAEPDVEEAASYMKKLYENSEFYKQIAENGKKYAEEKLGMKQAVNNITNYVNEIYEMKGSKE